MRIQTTTVAMVLTEHTARDVMERAEMLMNVSANLIAESVENGVRLKRDHHYRISYRERSVEYAHAEKVWRALAFPERHTPDGVYRDDWYATPEAR